MRLWISVDSNSTDELTGICNTNSGFFFGLVGIGVVELSEIESWVSLLSEEVSEVTKSSSVTDVIMVKLRGRAVVQTLCPARLPCRSSAYKADRPEWGV